MPPNIDVFVTSILSNPAIRSRHERVRRYLTSARVPYQEHDVAGDESAKSLWRRKNQNKNELPFLLVDGEPVGSIEEFDEAVEFGELRQFLRLDGSAPASFIAPSAEQTPSSTTVGSTAAAPPAENHSHASSKPTIDDFASLSLSPAELDELAREIATGTTFSSGLGSLSPPIAPLNFGSHATRTIEPVLPATQPLHFERVNFVRPLPDRPLASEVARDELEGIDTGELAEDELDKLARELEEEEAERRRLRDAQPEGSRAGPLPLPEQQGAAAHEEEPPLPPKTDHTTPPVATLSAELASATAITGSGGAALSAPLAEIEALRLSPREAAGLAPPSPGGATLEVHPVSALERAPPLPEESEEPLHADRGERTSRQEAERIRAELNSGAAGAGASGAGAAGVSEMPHFGVRDVMPPGAEEEPGRPADELAENNAAAIRGGDL